MRQRTHDEQQRRYLPFGVVAAAGVDDLAALRVLNAFVALPLALRYDIQVGLQYETATTAAARSRGKHIGAYVVRALVEFGHRNVMRIRSNVLRKGHFLYSEIQTLKSVHHFRARCCLVAEFALQSTHLIEPVRNCGGFTFDIVANVAWERSRHDG